MTTEARARVQGALRRLSDATPNGNFSVHRHTPAYRLTKRVADTVESISRAGNDAKAPKKSEKTSNDK